MNSHSISAYSERTTQDTGVFDALDYLRPLPRLLPNPAAAYLTSSWQFAMPEHRQRQADIASWLSEGGAGGDLTETEFGRMLFNGRNFAD